MKRMFGGLLLLALLALLPARSATQDKKPALNASEIISKHLEAAGTREKLAQFKSRIAIGTIRKENDPATQMAIMSEAPNRVSAAFIFPGYDWRLGFDGSKTIFRPQLPRIYGGIETKFREMLASGLMFNGISLHNLLLQSGNDVKFEAKGIKKLRGRDTYVVEVRRAKTDAMRLYFDAQNFMWVRTDFGKVHISEEIKPFTNEVVSRGEDELTLDFYIETSDFRDVNGVKLPFRFELLVTMPILRQKTSGTIIGTISEYRHNQPINPQMFQ